MRDFGAQRRVWPKADRNRIVTTLLERLICRRGLPADFPREKILEAIRFDKKFERQEVRFVVTPAIGSARLATDVTMEDIEAAIERCSGRFWNVRGAFVLRPAL